MWQWNGTRILIFNNFLNVSVIINYIKNYTTHTQSTYTLYTIIGIMVKPWFFSKQFIVFVNQLPFDIVIKNVNDYNTTITLKILIQNCNAIYTLMINYKSLS
jgi:hypothetical protein